MDQAEFDFGLDFEQAESTISQNTNDGVMLSNYREKLPSFETKQHYVTITPVSIVNPFIKQKSLARNILDQETQKYLEGGILSVLKDADEIKKASQQIALYNYSRVNSYFADLFSAFYTAITTKDTSMYLDAEPVTKTINGITTVTGVDIVTTRKAINTALFGCLVDDNGRARNDLGSGQIIKNAKKIIDPILHDKERDAPMTYAKIKGTNGENIILYGKPISIKKRLESDSEDELFMFTLDTDYAPLKIQGDEIMPEGAAAQYIHNVAGLTAFMNYGERLANQKYDLKEKITVNTSVKVVRTLQVGLNLQQIKGIQITTKNGRQNAILRKSFFSEDLTPSAISKVRGKNYINYKKAIDVVNTSGIYYYEALQRTNLVKYLTPEQKDKIFIPATEHSLEFPEKYENTVLLKADSLKNK